VDAVVVEGVEVEDLKKGPGHYPDTALPGQLGNMVISGHRTTYGAPFYRLDELKVGDEITMFDANGPFVYKVTESKIVLPTEIGVIAPSSDARLTLTTCHPRFSAAKRLIIVAQLIGPPVDAPVAPAGSTPTTSPPRTSELAAGPDRAGLSGAGAANRPAIAWAILAGSVWLAAWAIGRWTGRRWTAYIVAAPVFFVTLFVFFENVARLLPANV